MFSLLSNKLQDVFKNLRGQGKISESNVQDAMRERAADLARLLADPNACFYVCGLKSMEEGVVLALHDIAEQAGLNWETVGGALKREGRLHLETY
jgi:benzoyl-CoA 2,3-dioxygenase component A